MFSDAEITDATLIPLFSSSELTGCEYPGLLDRKNRLDLCPGGSRTLNFVRARRAPYSLGHALHYEIESSNYFIYSVFSGPITQCIYSRKGSEPFIFLIAYTVKPLYNDIHYNSRIRYNVNLVCTKIS